LSLCAIACRPSDASGFETITAPALAATRHGANLAPGRKGKAAMTIEGARVTEAAADSEGSS